MTKVINAAGEEIDYFYENASYSGNLTKFTMADPSNTHNITGNIAQVVTYTYDPYNAYIASETKKYKGGTSTTQYEYEYIRGN